ARLQREARRIELRGDAWSDRAEGIETFPAGELHVFLLQVARGDVVRAGEPENVVAPRFTRDVLRFASDDDRQFSFEVDALRLRRAKDRPARRQKRAGWFEEDDGLGRRVIAQLFGMVRVVAAHGHDLPG